MIDKVLIKAIRLYQVASRGKTECCRFIPACSDTPDFETLRSEFASVSKDQRRERIVIDKALIKAIRLYQVASRGKTECCRFIPTCSDTPDFETLRSDFAYCIKRSKERAYRDR